MKSISKQLITISIIILLVGVSYTSAIRVENKIPIVEVEDDCGCNEVSNADIVILEKQLDRYSNLLLVLSKAYPEIREKCEEVLGIINSINLRDSTIICFILILIDFPIILSYEIFEILMQKYASSTLWQILFGIGFITSLVLAATILYIGYKLNCWDYEPFPPPHKVIQ